MTTDTRWTNCAAGDLDARNALLTENLSLDLNKKPVEIQKERGGNLVPAHSSSVACAVGHSRNLTDPAVIGDRSYEEMTESESRRQTSARLT